VLVHQLCGFFVLKGLALHHVAPAGDTDEMRSWISYSQAILTEMRLAKQRAQRFEQVRENESEKGGVLASGVADG
jgi:hypothetical protein